jgi:hypothetical protein
VVVVVRRQTLFEDKETEEQDARRPRTSD